MPNMSLDTYTFSVNPSDMPIIKAERSASYVDTYSGIAFFSWGPVLPGREILLEWTYMPADMWDQLDTLYQADAEVIFDPQDGSGKAYNVEILKLDGQWFLKWGTDSGTLRKNVKMVLLIMSEVGA